MTRWKEEIHILPLEMLCTTAFYIHQRNKWQTLITESDGQPTFTAGHIAYGYRQAHMWEQFRLQAINIFESVQARYPNRDVITR